MIVMDSVPDLLFRSSTNHSRRKKMAVVRFRHYPTTAVAMLQTPRGLFFVGFEISRIWQRDPR
jgi:hypothetical protein